jgi:predicted MFS family arabinose efflux permease
MSGLMVGILLARPLASFLADLWGWRAFYSVSAAAMAVLATVLALRLPRRKPSTRSSYPALIASLWRLLRAEPELRQRALTASLVMAAFSVFWTSVALRLAQPPFDLSQRGIALFALAGAGGAVATPLFGRFGDRGWTRPAAILSHLILIAAAPIAFLAGSTPLTPWFAFPLMLAGAILLDIAVAGDQTLGRRVINLLQPEARGRLNGLFVGLFFLGGAAGSGIAGVAWTIGGWSAICAAIALIGAAAIFADVGQRRRATPWRGDTKR